MQKGSIHMIIKMLSEQEEEERQYKRLGGSRQLRYHKLVNDIDKEPGKFVVAVDINENANIGHVVKMHYGQFGRLELDSIQIF